MGCIKDQTIFKACCLLFGSVILLRISCARRLLAPATGKGGTDQGLASRRVLYPLSILPRGLMAQVLGMPAGQKRDPVLFFVLAKTL